METLKVYQYRALGKRWMDTFVEKGNDSPELVKRKEDMNAAWEQLSAAERDVIEKDPHLAILAIRPSITRIRCVSTTEPRIPLEIFKDTLGAEAVPNDELVLIDIDVAAHPGWPPRVWERSSAFLAEDFESLREMRDWTDVDGVAYRLARDLGILGSNDNFTNSKWVFWTNNPLGNALVAILDKLAEATVLERREEPDIQFRWNERFKLEK